MIPPIFPKVPQSSLGILRVPQLPQLTGLFLKAPNPPKQGPNFNQNKGPHLDSSYIYIYTPEN